MMREAPNLQAHFDGHLYHVTDRQTAKKLLEKGFTGEGSYWSIGSPITDYYAELICDEGNEPVILSVRLDDFDQALLEPDTPSISEPLTWTLQTTEELVIGAWKICEGSWRDSMNLVGSVFYRGAIPPLHINSTD